MARGVDVRPVVGHPFFLITLIMAIAGWFTAFVGQVVLESKFHAAGGHGSAVGVPWFGIFLQMFLIVGVFSALASDTVAVHRFQLSLFLAIAVVFSVLGVNSGIFNSTAFQLAIGAGWMLLAVVNIFWLLFFSSEEDTFLLHIFNSGSHSSFSRRSRNGPTSRAGSVGGGGAMSVAGSAAGSGYQNPYTGVGKAGGPAGMSVGELAHDDGTRRSPTINSNTGESNTEYLLKAKALYSYSASPDDPNEISFTKGDILDIVDNSGKWWQARKADGTKGIIPSNYVVLT